MPDDRTISALRMAGVPDPDGTAVGDALHTLAVVQRLPDDYMVLAATSNVYGEGYLTGISMGDLRELIRLARVGQAVLTALERVGK